MNMDLKDKAYIITGASSGMGKATARLFAENGAKLILSGRDQTKGINLMEELRHHNPSIFFFAGDVGEIETNRKLIRMAEEHFGRLDGLVTNAGMLGLGSVTDIDLTVWHRTMEVNLYSVFYLCRFAIPLMQQSGGGSIVVTSSIAAVKSFPNHAAYNTSKAALVALAKQIALDYGPSIRANAICPGPVDTPLIWDSAKAFPDPSTAVEKAAYQTILKRLGQPEDIANLILFLASDKSSWMTGSVINIDGGVTIS